MKEITPDKLREINKALKRYKAEYDPSKKLVEFDGSVYTVYISIDYDETEGEFIINLCNPAKLNEVQREAFHKEIHFTTKVTNKLNSILNEQ